MSESAITSTLAQLATQNANTAQSTASRPQDLDAFQQALNAPAQNPATKPSNGPASIQTLQAVTAGLRAQQGTQVALAQTQQTAGAYSHSAYRPTKVTKEKTPFRKAVQDKPDLQDLDTVGSPYMQEIVPDAIRPLYREFQESVFTKLIEAGIEAAEKRKRVMKGIDSILADHSGKELSSSTMIQIQMEVHELGLTFDLASALAKKMTTFLETLFRA